MSFTARPWCATHISLSHRLIVRVSFFRASAAPRENCYEGTIAMISTAAKCTVLGLGALALSGCVQSNLRINPDFGRAVRQDEAAQIADPDAHYLGTPAPGSNGQRVGLAQKRYDKNQVIQPTQLGASSENVISNPTSGNNGNTNGDQAPTVGGP